MSRDKLYRLRALKINKPRFSFFLFFNSLVRLSYGARFRLAQAYDLFDRCVMSVSLSPCVRACACACVRVRACVRALYDR
jgi:hypothetical protein